MRIPGRCNVFHLRSTVRFISNFSNRGGATCRFVSNVAEVVMHEQLSFRCGFSRLGQVKMQYLNNNWKLFLLDRCLVYKEM